MSNVKYIRKSILISIISLFICIAMLVGSTFAWFTETVASNDNTIRSASSDSALYYKSPTDSDYIIAPGGEITFSNKWTPGKFITKTIKIDNKSDASIKYKLSADRKTRTGEIDLADVIDVYVFPITKEIDRALIDSSTPIGSLSLLAGQNSAIAKGAILPRGESGKYPSDYVEYRLVFAMRKTVDEKYTNITEEYSFSLKLATSKYDFTGDPLGDDYSDVGATVINRQYSVLPSVLQDLPEASIASAPGVVFSTSPYAYTNRQLFSGKHITKIGIPVKSVKAIDDNQTFTLSVVKTEENSYNYVSTNILTIPKDEIIAADPIETSSGRFSVNKWIYVDVDLYLSSDETLAFGMPGDTVEWGYSRTKNTTYAFRSATGGWTSPINESILFDVRAEETVTFIKDEHGLSSANDKDVFPSVLTDFPESAISSGNDVEFTNPPYSYLNQDLFSGARIKRIGIPVKRVSALDENQTFTLSVIKKGSGAYQYVSQHVLTLPLDQLGESTTVNKWIYIDLDITLGDDETLAFGGKTDTVIWSWKSGFSNTAYSFRDSKGGSTKAIFFDIDLESVFTYDDYLKSEKEEQDRLEAEKEQARIDRELKSILSDKGISILGDSISTFAGWSNNTSYNSTIGSNAVYYTGSKDGFTSVNETWWMQTINRTGLDLVVNNAWSGDEVTVRGITRALQLHNNDGREPDIIAVYLGINDFRRGKTPEQFSAAYDEMICGMLDKYREADVYLFTLVYTTNLEKAGVNPDDVVKFNDIIKSTAEKYSLTLVDLYNDTGINKTNLKTYMGDGSLHPNYVGMDQITRCFINALVENYLTD